MEETKFVTMLDGVSTAGANTSDVEEISGAQKVGFVITRADHTAGNTVYKFQGSIDNVDFFDLNLIVPNVTNANTETLTRAASVTLSSATSSMIWLDLDHAIIRYIRAVATITTDGSATVKMVYEQ